ncbi:calcium-binding protein [Rhizobium sp. LjRoot254]|uniref:calcium-binding protein n=1 Tax=Rhizobium sp. LjRoot254 TaxID=3342297 RepID=UPI003ED10575
MASYSFNADSIGDNIQADLGGFGFAYIGENVTVASLLSSAIQGSGSFHSVFVEGTVVGVGAILLGDDPDVDTGQQLFIGEQGSVIGMVPNFNAIQLTGSGSQIDNRGEIHSAFQGVTVIGNDAGGSVSRLDNHGTIEATSWAVAHQGSERFVVRNWGLISSFDGNAITGAFGNTVEEIVNLGEIVGSVYLDGGNDQFDGRKGIQSFVDAGGGDDAVLGGTGNEILAGGAGKDILSGGGGSDTFVFDAAPIAANADRVADFNTKFDLIRLDSIDFAGLVAGALAVDAFIANKSGKAQDAEDRIIYETDTGRLLYDADGKGGDAAELVATLSRGLRLTAADFFVI